MQTLSEIRSLLEARGMRPKRSLGQNFLVDQNLIRKLVDAAGVRAGELVLEVGPGTGTLTEELLSRGCRVIACELDDGLADLLRERMPPVIEGLKSEGKSAGTFELVHGDCLEDKHTLNGEVEAVLRREKAEGFKLVANLPYGAATPLISTLLIDHPECRMMAVTVQREVVDRLMAKAGTKEFGPLGVMAQSLCEVEKIATAGPQCFWPRPDVTSAMVVLRRRGSGPAGLSAKELSEACRVLFAHRRKQLGSVVDGLVDWKGLVTSRIAPTMRAEELSLGQVVELARELRKSE